MIQTVLNEHEYQGIAAIGAFDYENARSELVVITERNETQCVRLQLSIPRT